MKTKWTLPLSGAVVVAAVVVCWSEDKPAQNAPVKTDKAQASQSPISAANLAPASDFPVICSLEKRDRIITIKAGPNATLYSVKTTDGKVLAENLSIEQLRAQAPELHEFIKSAVAGGGVSGSGGAVDARVSPRLDVGMR